MKKLNILDIEIALMQHLNIRQNIIVPNVFWGMGFMHECDLFVMSKNNYGHEIEIKTSRADLKADLKKWHGHRNDKISRLSFAIPDYMEKDIALIPEKAGILIIERVRYEHSEEFYIRVFEKRRAKINNRYKFTDKERCKLAELGCMRILGFKETIRNNFLYNRQMELNL